MSEAIVFAVIISKRDTAAAKFHAKYCAKAFTAKFSLGYLLTFGKFTVVSAALAASSFAVVNCASGTSASTNA